LGLAAKSDSTEVVKAVASAIRLDQNLEHLSLQKENGFKDEAGVVLAEALTVNQTLRKIELDTYGPHNRATLGAPAYAAFSAMLRVNTSLVLKLPPFETAGMDEWLRESVRIEQRLNTVGHGTLLASSKTTREQWVDALHELNSGNVDDDSPAFRVSCLYSVLRSNPTVVSMS
jgi:hypothetical protein